MNEYIRRRKPTHSKLLYRKLCSSPMESFKSFNRYGKFDNDELQETEFRRRTRRRVIILSISIFLLIILVIGIVAGALVHRNYTNGAGEDLVASSSSRSAVISSVCNVTQYPDSCLSSLKSSNSSQLEDLFLYSLMAARNSLVKVSKFPEEYANRTDDPLVKEALNVCGAVLEDAVLSLDDSIAASSGGGGKVLLRIDDVRTWLSAAVTDQETCFDALEEAHANFVAEVRVLTKNSIELVSNSLAIVSKVLRRLGDFTIKSRRRLLEEAWSDFPAWIAAEERRMLHESNPTPNVTVAADGSGNVKTINAAVAMIPTRRESRFVVYIKAGNYVENVVMNSSYWNVMMYGDGKESTIVSGKKNVVDYDLSTYETATFAIDGKGFIARDIGFQNTAGPAKNQAVAFRSGSDLSVLFRCSFQGFQDTLYPHSNRQFYRKCDIAGTVDFIFGNAAVVFQDCTILPRQPAAGQFVTITAQGRTDPNQNTGISIQRCVLTPQDNLTASTYLGRPWKNLSTTVVMESVIGKFLDPKGWSSWDRKTDPPETIFYGEYRNTGPGAITIGRVTWQGYESAMTVEKARKYRVQSFIQGSSWLPKTNVQFNLN